MIKIVAISGKSGAGKDLFASNMEEISRDNNVKCLKMSFAYLLKIILATIIKLIFLNTTEDNIDISIEDIDRWKNENTPLSQQLFYKYKSVGYFHQNNYFLLIVSVIALYVVAVTDGIFLAIVVCCSMFFIYLKTVEGYGFRTLLQKLGTDILRKNLGEQVFVLALLNNMKKLVERNEKIEIVLITDCRMNEFKLLEKWLPVVFPENHESFQLKQVYIERPTFFSSGRIMSNDEKIHQSESVILNDNCHKIFNDSTLDEFAEKSEYYWINL